VGGADEADLVGGGGEVDAGLESGVEDAGEFFTVGGIDVLGAGGVFGLEVDPEDGADGGDVDRFGFEDGVKFFDESRGVFFEGGPAVVVDQVFEGGHAAGERERVARQGAGLVDRAVGGEEVHDFGRSAESADGESATDNFAVGREVGGDAVVLGGSTRFDAEAGNDLIEN